MTSFLDYLLIVLLVVAFAAPLAMELYRTRISGRNSADEAEDDDSWF